jgi:hypothetical protein
MAFMSAPAAAGGEFVPILAYNAVSGRLALRDRVQNVSGDWEAKETDVTMTQPAFAVDFGRLEVGWCHFVKGMAPLWSMVPYGQPLPERPASPGQDISGKVLNYRNGFRVPVAGNAIGGVREMAGNSAALINGMNALHTAFEAAPEAAMGKIPVVKLVSADPVKAGQATNYQPVFEIVSWVVRPDVLGPRTVAPPRASAPVNVPVSQMPPGQVAAMAAASVPTRQATTQPARAPAMADSEMPF